MAAACSASVIGLGSDAAAASGAGDVAASLTIGRAGVATSGTAGATGAGAWSGSVMPFLASHASETEVSLEATRCLSASRRASSAAMRMASVCIRSASLSARTRAASSCVLVGSRTAEAGVPTTGSGSGDGEAFACSEALSFSTSAPHSQRSSGHMGGELLQLVSHHSTEKAASALQDTFL